MFTERKKYYSTKKVNEIIDLLKNNTLDEFFFNLIPNKNLLFEGKIYENKFRIQEVLPRRYGLKPNIFGTLKQDNENAHIEILIRPRYRSFLFLLFLLVFIFTFEYLIIFEIKQVQLIIVFSIISISILFISYYSYKEKANEIKLNFEKTLDLKP